MQGLHPFAGSIQQYAEEIAVYHPPALADDACRLTTPGSISVRQISVPARHTPHLHPGYPPCTSCDIRGLATPIHQPLPLDPPKRSIQLVAPGERASSSEHVHCSPHRARRTGLGRV